MATAFVYGLAAQSLANKEIDFDSDTINVMLCTSTYVPNQDTHRYKSSVTNEVVGTGYTAGGQVLTGKTVTYTAATNQIKLAAANTTWTTSTITARYAIIYDALPATDAARPLLSYVDFGLDVISSGDVFTITWDTAGIVTLTVA